MYVYDITDGEGEGRRWGGRGKEKMGREREGGRNRIGKKGGGGRKWENRILPPAANFTHTHAHTHAHTHTHTLSLTHC